MQHSVTCQCILSLSVEICCSLIHIVKEFTWIATDQNSLVELRREYVLVKCRADEFPLNEFMKTAAIRLQRVNRLFYFNLYVWTRATRCVFVAFRMNLCFMAQTLCWESGILSTVQIKSLLTKFKGKISLFHHYRQKRDKKLQQTLMILIALT